MTGLFEQLKSISQAGIFSLINESDKTVYIGKSSNMGQALARLLNKSQFFIPEYTFKVLETTDPSLLNLKGQYWMDYFLETGYQILNKKRSSNKHIKKVLLGDFRHHGNQYLLWYVKIVSRGTEDVTVGVFDGTSSGSLLAEEFIARHYSNGVRSIVYCNNPLTDELVGKK